MNHHCPDPGELVELLARQLDDPQRREAAGCARCSSLLCALESFLAGDPALPEADRAAAERHLAGVIAGFPGRRVAAPVIALPRKGTNGRRGVPTWGWGVGLAAMLAAVAFLAAQPGRGPTGPNGVLRGGPPPAGAPVEIMVAAAPAGADTWRLSWPAVSGAHHYQLEIFAADLDTIASFGPLPEPMVTVAQALLAGAPRGAAGILCRVRAVGPAGEIAVSRLSPLALPAASGAGPDSHRP